MSLIRALGIGDVEDLLTIEQAAAAYPWSRRQFSDGLAAKEFGWGIEIDRRLVAFTIFNAVLDETTLLDIAVHPDFQRRGLARKLLAAALRELPKCSRVRCLLEVRVSNGAAITLYKSLGFNEDGRRRNYYPTPGGREDALLMSKILHD
ncbi:MAG: ribosomal protein S18-alanine N-acetyltransferase [Spongiibacteraceae bacterium]